MKEIKAKFIKIREFILKHYVIFIPICLIVVLLLTYGIFTIRKIYYNYSEEYQEKGYLYFAGVKVEDDFKIKINRDKEIIGINSNKKVDLDSILYFDKTDSVVFLKDMTLILVHDNYKQYRVSKYSKLTYDSKNDTYRLKTQDYENEISNFILYDGIDTYFFDRNSTLNIGNEKIELTNMSYVVSNNNNSLQYYDKASDKFVIRDITNEKIRVSNDTYDVNLNEDKVITVSSFILLNKPKNLDLIR